MEGPNPAPKMSTLPPVGRWWWRGREEEGQEKE